VFPLTFSLLCSSYLVVLARASFGIRGALLPTMLRAAVACAWFGVQTWLGGASVFAMAQALTGAEWLAAPAVAWLGISWPQFGCFLLFWALQVAVVLRGMEGIRILERYSAPLLVVMCVGLLAWALGAAGGLGPILAAPSQFAVGGARAGQFLPVFLSSLTASVSYWGTLALNIGDFTRMARTQKAQVYGQALGLPLFMGLYTFVGGFLKSLFSCFSCGF
jgi:nucleobase:cation symporter-1, NCS1 family